MSRTVCITLAALLAASDAFVVPSHSNSPPSASSFVERSQLQVVPYGTSNAVAVYNPSRVKFRCASSSTALRMNLFDRFMRVVKSNFNTVLNSLEAPEKIMNQAVDDMGKDLVKIRRTYSEVTAAQRRLLRQKNQAESVAEHWYNRAQLALRRGKEDLAREALARRQQQLELVKDLQPQIDAQAKSLDKVYDGMQAIESKIVEAKSKKDQYIARAKTAESVKKVNDMLSGITGKTSMDAFRRMADKVEALEAAAEASAEMAGMNNLLLPGGGKAAASLEQEFVLLEGSAAVDRELAKMKKNFLAPSSSKGGITVEVTTRERSWQTR